MVRRPDKVVVVTPIYELGEGAQSPSWHLNSYMTLVCLIKWNTGTVTIRGVGRDNIAEYAFVCFILGGKLVAVINSMGLSSIINGGRWGGIMDAGEM